eukprot:CAMPEP_0117613528 /NCGR_PEP_ID=MMETSP0784-20121206/83519_1 /TAXON_ID=39447 /ORGANISM="" /LENGTH=103 /DNA_ID=CAMNT_0005417133 /DNA_START=23 /DNA_END=332 /DNA_ORIENTATION=-
MWRRNVQVCEPSLLGDSQKLECEVPLAALLAQTRDVAESLTAGVNAARRMVPIMTTACSHFPQVLHAPMDVPKVTASGLGSPGVRIDAASSTAHTHCDPAVQA